MRHDYSIEYQKAVLTPLTEEDSEKLRVLRNRNSDRFLDRSYISSETQRNWYYNYLEIINDYMFSVRLCSDNRWIGAAGIYNIDTVQKIGEFGRLVIDQNAAGTGGYGVIATKAISIIAFTQLQLKKLKLEVYYNNVPALVTYLKAGFLPVGMTGSSSMRLVQMELDWSNGEKS